MDSHEFKYTFQNLKNIIPHMDSPMEAIEACWTNFRNVMVTHHRQLEPYLYGGFKNPVGYGGALDAKAEGNKAFKSKQFQSALEYYNYALCKAVPGSEIMGQLYANRAAICLVKGRFSLCLENIQLARENNYPKEDLPKLEKREQRCLEAMLAAGGQDQVTADPKTSSQSLREMKLSFPANPKNPMMVEGIKVALSAEGVMELRAERDFAVGDVIIREPYLNWKYPLDMELCCLMCSEGNSLSLKPCKGCMYALFCSDECEERAMKMFHRLECVSMKAFHVHYHDRNRWFPRLGAQCLFRILSMYPNLDQVRRQIVEWRRNPTKIFEENNQDPEMIQIKLFFARKVDFPMTEMVHVGTVISDLFALLLHNPKLAALINTREDELIVLDILLTISTFPFHVMFPEQAEFSQPLFEYFLGETKTSNANRVLCQKEAFYYVSRPIKKDQLIILDCATRTTENISMEKFLENMDIEPGPSTGLQFSNFDFNQEFRQLFPTFPMKPTKEFVLEAEERYRTILTTYDQHWPCKELMEVRYLHAFCMDCIYLKSKTLKNIVKM